MDCIWCGKLVLRKKSLCTYAFSSRKLPVVLGKLPFKERPWAWLITWREKFIGLHFPSTHQMFALAYHTFSKGTEHGDSPQAWLSHSIISLQLLWPLLWCICSIWPHLGYILLFSISSHASPAIVVQAFSPPTQWIFHLLHGCIIALEMEFAGWGWGFSYCLLPPGRRYTPEERYLWSPISQKLLLLIR